MNKETLAALLNGRTNHELYTTDEARDAKEAGLVICYGASEDLMEFYGAICEEYGSYDGGDIEFTKTGKEITNDIRERIEELEEELGFKIVIPSLNKITANWCPYDAKGASWTFTTDIPHSTFEVMEDGELYCIGIVFHIDSLKE